MGEYSRYLTAKQMPVLGSCYNCNRAEAVHRRQFKMKNGALAVVLLCHRAACEKETKDRLHRRPQ